MEGEVFSKGNDYYRDLNNKEVEVVFLLVSLSNFRCVTLFFNLVIFLFILLVSG